jgi:hypothetical protein
MAEPTWDEIPAIVESILEAIQLVLEELGTDKRAVALGMAIEYTSHRSPMVTDVSVVATAETFLAFLEFSAGPS